jgi:hypothetical protein
VVALSRRRFLGAAWALVAGAVLGACGADEAERSPPSDAEVLDGLLRREQDVVAAGADAGQAERALRDQDRRHAARLAEGLAALGVAAAPATAAGDPADLLARKQQAVFAYVDALPRLSDPELRVLVMQIAASEAEHIAALRLAAGEPPLSDAFAGFGEAGRAP